MYAQLTDRDEQRLVDEYVCQIHSITAIQLVLR